MTTLDLKEKIEADRRADVPGGSALVCSCPTCGVAQLLLHSALEKRRVRDFDIKRVTIRACDFAGGAYPYIASVRVDGREVYRIHARPDEVFAPDVLDDIVKALRRPM
jgi:hypothetical protein